MHLFGLGFLFLFLTCGVHGINPFRRRSHGNLQSLNIVANSKLVHPRFIEIKEEIRLIQPSSTTSFLPEYEYSDDDISDAAPAMLREEAAEEDSDSAEDAKDDASLQFMITNRMRRVLEDDLNYHIEEIEVMDPQIASVVIERGLARPPTGMPKAWQSIKPSKTLTSDMRKLIFNMMNGARSKIFSCYRAMTNVMKFTAKNVIPIVIPTVGIVYGLPKVFSLGMKVGTSIANNGGSSPRRIPIIRKVQTSSHSAETMTSRRSVDSNLIVSLNENRIDMKALNDIVKPRSLIEKLFGR